MQLRVTYFRSCVNLGEKRNRDGALTVSIAPFLSCLCRLVTSRRCFLGAARRTRLNIHATARGLLNRMVKSSGQEDEKKIVESLARLDTYCTRSEISLLLSVDKRTSLVSVDSENLTCVLSLEIQHR